jgi:hypothetical protein
MPTKPTTKRGRGRPAFQPTAAMRRKVSIAAGGGMRHDDIALALGIARDTLTKYFDAELSTGASARRMEVMEALHAAAKKGSSSAAKAYLAVEAKLAAPPADAPQQEAKQPLAAPVGKKDAANVAAKTAQAGTGWDGLLPGGPLQ